MQICLQSVHCTAVMYWDRKKLCLKIWVQQYGHFTVLDLGLYVGLQYISIKATNVEILHKAEYFHQTWIPVKDDIVTENWVKN